MISVTNGPMKKKNHQILWLLLYRQHDKLQVDQVYIEQMLAKRHSFVQAKIIRRYSTYVKKSPYSSFAKESPFNLYAKVDPYSSNIQEDQYSPLSKEEAVVISGLRQGYQHINGEYKKEKLPPFVLHYRVPYSQQNTLRKVF